jgi:hypothetical protein
LGRLVERPVRSASRSVRHRAQQADCSQQPPPAARTSIAVPASAAAAQPQMIGRIRCPPRPAIIGTARTVKVERRDARDAAVWARASAWVM